MSTFDTFLPSGAVEQRRPFRFPDAQFPRSAPPDHFPNFPARRGFSTSPHTGTPISPPRTRSGSADEDTAALIEDWRAFTRKIREQARGERAHLLADRARADEVMEEERELWEQERTILKARIDQLEAELAAKHADVTSRTISSTTFATARSKSSSRLEAASVSGSGSHDISPASSVPQESGRNPDGSPFYAPAPTNPSRSFNPRNQELRIDSITQPRETPIRVTSKTLRPVDFGIQSPERQAVHETPHTMIGESIDISLIQPSLEGVPIKTSAVDPVFAATVLSPHESASPSKPSPLIRSPEETPSPPSAVRRVGKEMCTLEVVSAPENRRLTMHAGHTPSHSISKLDLGDLSSNATPTQRHSVIGEHIHNTSMATEGPDFSHESKYEGFEEDPVLSGQLGFTNDAASPQNDIFARELVKRLSEEALKQSMANHEDNPVDDEDEEFDQVPENLETRKEKSSGSGGDGVEVSAGITSPPIDGLPRLRLRPSTNFGKPFGTL